MDSTRIRMDKTPFRIEGHHHMAADLPRQWIVLPPGDRTRALRHPLLKGLLPSHIGFFPSAKHHRIHRPEGLDQAIFKYCVHGAGWCEVDDRRFDVGPGDLMVVPPQAPHAYGSSVARPWTVHWFHAMGSELGLLLRELGVSTASPVVHLGRDAQLVRLLQDLEHTLEHDCAFPQLLYASQLLGHIVGLMIRLRRAHPTKAPAADQRVLRSAEEMTERLDLPLDVAQLASSANLSISHYAALFRRLVGSSPKSHFDHLRLHRAAALLLTTHETVQAIAQTMGYKDPLYFSRTFRRVHGVSPSEYRREYGPRTLG